MKVQLISDIHGQFEKVSIDPSIDLLIVAGDLQTSHYAYATSKPFLDIWSTCQLYDVEVVFVAGNHDYYGRDIDDVEDELLSSNINFLTVGEEYKTKKDNYTIVGCTLFTDFKLPSYTTSRELTEFKYSINDFRYIHYKDRLITPQDYIKLYKHELKWLEQYRGRDDVIVVTHFPPSVKCIQEKYADNMLNPYFINNIDLHGFKHWFCGHTHTTMIKNVDGCNIYINAIGYGDECKNTYNDNFIINI